MLKDIFNSVLTFLLFGFWAVPADALSTNQQTTNCNPLNLITGWWQDKNMTAKNKLDK